jgi:hypothetical protein
LILTHSHQFKNYISLKDLFLCTSQLYLKNSDSFPSVLYIRLNQNHHLQIIKSIIHNLINYSPFHQNQVMLSSNNLKEISHEYKLFRKSHNFDYPINNKIN